MRGKRILRRRRVTVVKPLSSAFADVGGGCETGGVSSATGQTVKSTGGTIGSADFVEAEEGEGERAGKSAAGSVSNHTKEAELEQ